MLREFAAATASAGSQAWSPMCLMSTSSGFPELVLPLSRVTFPHRGSIRNSKSGANGIKQEVKRFL